MRIIPVIDILNGVAVHAFAGQRRWYEPVQSVLVEGSDPVRLLQAIRRRFGCTECYVADIDRIQGRPLNRQIVEDLCGLGLHVMLEAGIRTAADLQDLPVSGPRQIVVGSETLTSLDELGEIIRQLGADRVIFSLDLQRGELLASNSAWAGALPIDVVREVEAIGVQQLILLDLATIGTGGGVRSLDLCRRVRANLPGLSVIVGGGIRSGDDLQALQNCGADGVLMASAFHYGTLTLPQIREFSESGAVRAHAESSEE